MSKPLCLQATSKEEMQRFIDNLLLIAKDFEPQFQIKQTMGDPYKDNDTKSQYLDGMPHKPGAPAQINVDKLDSGSKDEDKKDEGPQSAEWRDNDAKSSKKNSEAMGARVSQMVSKGGSNL